MERLESDTVDRDRSAWLLLAGVLEILLGVGIGLVIPALLVLVSVAGGAGGAVGAASTASMVVLHLVVGAAVVVLGVGSMRARRWARVVWVSVSWIWLVTGVLSLAVSGLMMPALLRSAGLDTFSRGAVVTVAAAVLCVLAVLYVVLPAALLIFYRSPSVEATCRARGPARQWTDGLPPQVVTLVIVWAAAAASVAVMPAYNWAVPFFGAVLSGVAGAAVWLVVAVSSLVLAVASSRVRAWAWSWSVALSVAAAVSTVVTFVRVEPAGFVAAMQLPADQAALMTGLSSVGRWPAVAFWIIVWATFVVYLWRLRPFFVDD